MLSVVEVSYEESEALIKGDKSIVHNKEGKHYGLIAGGRLVSVLTAVEEKKKVKIKGMFTPVEERKKGYGYALLNGVCELIKKPIIARAVPDSVNIFLRQGFKLKKESQCGQFKIYSVEKTNG